MRLRLLKSGGAADPEVSRLSLLLPTLAQARTIDFPAAQAPQSAGSLLRLSCRTESYDLLVIWLSEDFRNFECIGVEHPVPERRVRP